MVGVRRGAKLFFLIKALGLFFFFFNVYQKYKELYVRAVLFKKETFMGLLA